MGGWEKVCKMRWCLQILFDAGVFSFHFLLQGKVQATSHIHHVLHIIFFCIYFFIQYGTNDEVDGG